MSDCPKEENLRDAVSATLSAAQGKERDRGTEPVPFLGETLRMCLAGLKEWNVVRLGSKSRGFFFLSPAIQLSCFSSERFC